MAASRAPAGAAGAAPGGQRAAREQRPAGDQVGGGAVELARLPRRPLGAEPEGEAGERRARDARTRYSTPAIAARPRPVSSALAMKPRALLAPSRRRNDDASRLDVSTTAGASVVAGELLADREAVDVGQLHVEQHERRLERARGGERGGAVVRLADDLEAVGVEQRAGEGAEVRVVVDDQDAPAHAAMFPRPP